jgi:hypothetical protein
VRAAALLLLFACSSDPAPVDAGIDAGTIDAAPDGGAIQFACKDLTCNASEEYCQLTPVGQCRLDAGTCAAGEEECVTNGIGCTPERTPSCEPLGACDNCPCLIQRQPCAGDIQCRTIGGSITLECPYPL